MRRPMVAGNWKMNGTRASVAELIESFQRQAPPAAVEIAVFPPLCMSVRSWMLSMGCKFPSALRIVPCSRVSGR